MPHYIAFSADATRLLAANDDGQVFLLDAASGKLLPTGDTHRGPVSALFFAPEDTEAYSAGRDATLRRWSVSTGKLLDPICKADSALSAADGGKSLLVTGSSKGGLHWWERSSGKLLAQASHAGAVTFLKLVADESLLLSASADATARLWEADGSPATDPIKHDSGVTAAAFSPELKRFATGTSGGLVHVFSLDGKAAWANPAEQRGQVTALAWAPHGKALATGSSSGEIVLWDAASGRRLANSSEHEGAITALAFGPGVDALASASEDGTARILNSGTLKPITEAMKHAAKVLDITWDASSKTVATRASDGHVFRWSATKGTPLWEPVALQVVAAPPTAPVTLDPRTFVRVGTDRLVTVAGVTGLFTPLGGEPGKPLEGDERTNLLGLIDSLKRELASAQGRSLQLQSDLDLLRQRTAPAADFASGVQQSLDELQQRLATMRNPISNFAVRELKLEAGVSVQIAPTGAIEYRFIQSGEETTSAAVSRLSINVVPMPKDNLAGVWTSNLFQPEQPLTILPDISTEQVRQLEGQGMFSIGEFVQVSTRLRAQAYLVALLGVDRQRLALWAQQAGLMTLRGVDGRVAVTLIGAGLGSFEALAGQTPATVSAGYEAERLAKPEHGAPSITEATAALWVRAARQFLGLPALEDSAPAG